MALSGLPALKSSLKSMFQAMRDNPPIDVDHAVAAEQKFCDDLADLLDTFVRTAVVKVDTGITVDISHITDSVAIPSLACSVSPDTHLGATSTGTGTGSIGGNASTNSIGNGHVE
jgi:hypothetical protein